MFHDLDFDKNNAPDLAHMGSDAIAYMREMSVEEILAAFPQTPNLKAGENYWALFGADGTPLMLATQRADIALTAFENNMKAILPN
jgi:hypothetical protein